MITKEQEEYIVANYYVMTNAKIGAEIGISKYMVSHYARKLGLKKNGGPLRLPLTQEQEDYIRANYKTMTTTEIGTELGYTNKQIQSWLDSHYKDRERKKRQFNNRYFQDITTPEQAYWLGFIYADGWLSKHRRDNSDPNSRWTYEFGMELQRQDEYMLYALNEALGGKHIVKQKSKKMRILKNKVISETHSSVLRVYSKDLVTDLYNHGIDYHKTTSEIFPIVEDYLFPDFLRGYIDGDGCIHQMKKGILGLHITSANKLVLEYIQKKLLDDYDISSKIYSEEFDEWRTKY